MKKIITFFIGALLLSFGVMIGQTDRQGGSVEKCATAIIHNRLMQTDPAYKARMLANEQLIQNIIDQQKLNKSGPNQTLATVYTIPVVVHVIHLGEAVGVGTNISDAQIQSAIDNLTDAYRNQSPYTGVDIEVEFALAQRDPNCNATTGINRVNGSGVNDYTSNGLTTTGTDNEVTVKALSKWPNSTYYNIWIVAGIDGNMGGGGVQGFAYFPGASSSVDGAVILYNSFGYDPTGTLGYNLKSYTNRNVTTIHELGHGFNLFHTFEGDGSGSTCPTGNQCGNGVGDCCADTPPHMRSSSDCDVSGTNSCDGGSSKSLYVHNFMDYSSDVCQTEFTADQKTRIRAALVASRGGLLNSLATTPPSGSLPTAGCVSTTTDLSGNFPLGVYGFTFNDLDVSSGSSYSDNGYADRTCYFQTTVTAGNSYPVTVNTYTAYQHDVRVYIDYNDDGDFNDGGEAVFTADNGMTTHSGTITIAASPPITGQVLRMRVLVDWNNNTIADGCYDPQYGQAEDFGITINPAGGSAPVANFSGTPTSVCVGSSVAFTDLSTNSPTSWVWTFEGGNPATSTSQNPTVTYTAVGTYSVSLTATNVNGSDVENKTAYITVNSLPSVTAGATNNPVCSGGSTTLNGGGASTYTWSGGVTNGVAFTPTATATYTVTGTDGNGCSNSQAILLTVNPTPTVNVSGTMTITSGGTTTLTASGATTYSWVPGTGLSATTGATVTASPTVTTAYTVTGTSSGCSGTKTFTITVTPPPGPTNLQPAYCGITETSLTQVLYCVPVNGASQYRYRLVDNSNGNVYLYIRTNNLTNFQMNWVTSVGYAKTYNITVAALVSGTWTSYGTACNVTTPAPPTTKLQTAYCGITETSLNQVLYCDAVVGATQYRYELTDISNNNVYVYVRTTNLTNFQMDWVPNVTYSKTYSIKAAAYVGGVWLAYGSACNVTTPAPPTTKLQTAYCGITETSLSQVLYCDAVVGATQYRYELTDISNSNVYIYTRTTNLTNFQMSWVSSVGYGKTYSIKVAAYVGGVWLAYGVACNVTTPGAPTTKLASGSCNIVESSFNQVLYCDAVTGATQYRYELTDISNSNVYFYTRTTNLTNFQMNWVTGVTTSKTYDVRVTSYVGGTWLAYGPVCSVTTAASLVFDGGEATLPGESSNERKSAAEGISLNLFPNPNDGHVYLQVNHDAQLTVSNLLGEIVYEGSVTNGSNELYFIDVRPGMYIVTVSDGVQTKQVRMIKE